MIFNDCLIVLRISGNIHRLQMIKHLKIVKNTKLSFQNYKKLITTAPRIRKLSASTFLPHKFFSHFPIKMTSLMFFKYQTEKMEKLFAKEKLNK